MKENHSACSSDTLQLYCIPFIEGQPAANLTRKMPFFGGTLSMFCDCVFGPFCLKTIGYASGFSYQIIIYNASLYVRNGKINLAVF